MKFIPPTPNQKKNYQIKNRFHKIYPKRRIQQQQQQQRFLNETITQYHLLHYPVNYSVLTHKIQN